MNKIEFRDLVKSTFIEILELTKTKGDEYTVQDADQLANFNRLSKELCLPRMKILSVYLSKHMDGIKSYVNTGMEYSSEPVTGRIDDAILYLILLKAMVIEDKSNEQADVIYKFAVGEPE